MATVTPLGTDAALESDLMDSTNSSSARTDRMASPAPRTSPADNNEDVVRKIIEASRKAHREEPVVRSSWAAWLGAGLTGMLTWASFAPLEWAWCGWLAWVPVLALILARERPSGLYVACYVCSALCQLVMLQWLRLGDKMMYMAWVSLSLYVAVYLPVLVAICRYAVHTLRVPLVLAFPVALTAGEYLRGHLITGFGWYQLGHSQYRWLDLIQISDLVGAYGVSFVVACSTAALTLAIVAAAPTSLRKWFPFLPAQSPDEKLSRLAMQILVPLLVFGVTLGYGMVRRSQAHFLQGPRVALIQGNIPATLESRVDDSGPIFTSHVRMTGMAVAERPDLVVWPETMFRWPLAEVPEGLTDAEIQQRAPESPVSWWRDPTVKRILGNESQKANAAMIIGLEAIVPGEKGIERYNSAAFIRPDAGYVGRSDKVHLVPFGEYVPFVKELPFLQAFSPYPPGFGLTAGTDTTLFDYKGWRLMPIICFEDTVPHLVRGMVASGSQHETGKQVDVIVNLSNDGWFHGSSGLNQHLITAAFRAVECRTPLVRAVNTGVSAFIDGDGAILEPDTYIDGDRAGRTGWRDPRSGQYLKQVNQALVRSVPLDDRTSFYVSWGDWFAQLCLAATIFVCLVAATTRWWKTNPGRQ